MVKKIILNEKISEGNNFGNILRTRAFFRNAGHAYGLNEKGIFL